ncbi:CLUMA_CG015630, isoform A [Clunio marinus]|uniref:CLUMA_CG015630, isoform A n=1 Tax=Clunio marinus TaxID=568069 RepID=A0A1J1IPB1_9DIPT|nr:CLUMA_CG015630, isoform A [Clunio marinus]
MSSLYKERLLYDEIVLWTFHKGIVMISKLLEKGWSEEISEAGINYPTENKIRATIDRVYMYDVITLKSNTQLGELQTKERECWFQIWLPTLPKTGKQV